jgi:molecular chaperone HtpG
VAAINRIVLSLWCQQVRPGKWIAFEWKYWDNFELSIHHSTLRTVQLLLDLYEREYGAFGHMAKDFARTGIFPRVSDLVPSATRQGAEAFLKSIARTREVFEYETADLESLKGLLKDLLEGKVTIQEAAQRSEAVASRSYQVLDAGATAPVREVVPDVIENETALPQILGAGFDPMPPIQRLDIETQRKLLTIREDEPALKGYRCFLAISDRVRDEKGDFFLQPHRTSVVWGGQRALFVFEHHSGEFGLYYDVQTPDLVSQGSGGGPFETSTIVTKNRIFIPLPPAIQSSFVPSVGEKKRLELRCDILYLDHR